MPYSGSDVIVIGAGIIGSACAFRLAEQGLRVTLLERCDRTGEGSTGRSGAGVRTQFSEEVNVRLSWESIQEYRDFQERFGRDSGYRPNGYLFLVPEAAWADQLAGLAVQRRVGAPVEVLDPADAQALVPFCREGVYRCTYGPQDGYIDPLAVMRAYLDLAAERGARLHCGAAVEHLAYREGAWQVQTPQGSFSAPLIVNAAGAWAGEVARRAGLEVPVQPVKRSVYRTRRGNGTPSYPLTVDVASNFWLRGHGHSLIFTISRPDQPPGFHEGIDWDWLSPVRAVGQRRFPWLAELDLDPGGSFWGYYEVTPDGSPVLGPLPGVPGWLNACGFSGHGVQQAAAVGRVIAAQALGQPPFIDVGALGPERFGRSGGPVERHIV